MKALVIAASSDGNPIRCSLIYCNYLRLAFVPVPWPLLRPFHVPVSVPVSYHVPASCPVLDQLNKRRVPPSDLVFYYV